MSIDPVTGTGAPTTSDAAAQKAAAGFEELLVQQLAQVLVDSTQPDAADGEITGGDGSDATTSLLQSFLPDALAQSVTAAGGLGLASTLSGALQEPAR